MKTNSHPIIGDLSSMKERKKDFETYYAKKHNRDAFFKFYGKLINELKELGWKKFTQQSLCELWVENGQSSTIAKFFIDPWMLEDVFRIRFDLFDEKYVREVAEKIRKAITYMPGLKTVVVKAERKKKKRDVVEEVVDVSISRSLLLEKATSVEAVEEKISEFVIKVIEIADSYV